MTRDAIAIRTPRADWLAQVTEEIIEPDLPIVDPHHHLWDRLGGYLLDELLADTATGHNIVATVFVQCRHGYRVEGPEHLKPVGESEMAIAVAEDCDRRGGPTRAVAGIVSFADMTLGAAVDEVLQAQIAAAKGRFRGIRHITATDASFDTSLPPVAAGLMMTPAFREGVARLAPAGLSFDGWLYHPQIPEFTALARACPDTQMILDHVGGPLGIGAYRGRQDEVFAGWKAAMTELSGCPNVAVKLGGLVMDTIGCPWPEDAVPPTSKVMAEAFRPWVDTTIELFGPDRCMFESNFPVDKVACSYPVLWNAFKRLTEGASAAEKASLFHDTAQRVYRLEL